MGRQAPEAGRGVSKAANFRLEALTSSGGSHVQLEDVECGNEFDSGNYSSVHTNIQLFCFEDNHILPVNQLFGN